MKQNIIVNTAESKCLSFLAIIYTALLILSNLTASKVSELGGYHFTAVIFLFPFTYIIDDILTEVYGFKVSRRIIWMGLLGNLIVLLGSLVVLQMPPSEHWNNQQAFEQVFGTSFRILLASVLAYLSGEFLNSVILAKLKVQMQGKLFGVRAILSTIVGAATDTTVFMFVAFSFILPVKIIIGMVFIEYLIKLAVEIIVLPITSKIVTFLKAYENIDYYDNNTKFNLFSLKLTDA